MQRRTMILVGAATVVGLALLGLAIWWWVAGTPPWAAKPEAPPQAPAAPPPQAPAVAKKADDAEPPQTISVTVPFGAGTSNYTVTTGSSTGSQTVNASMESTAHSGRASI